jgi:hypothetical protein
MTEQVQTYIHHMQQNKQILKSLLDDIAEEILISHSTTPL